MDLYNYLSPDTSFEKLCKAYKTETGKLTHAYEWLDSYDKLYFKGFPAYEQFFSKLKNSNIDESLYNECKKMFEEKKFTYYHQWLEEYNNQDVAPMIEIVKKMQLR